MTSQYSDDFLEYTNTLLRPSTTKGSVHASNASGVFQHVSPTENGQILTSDNTTASGVKWAASGSGVGFAIPAGDTIALPGTGSTIFFLNRGDTNPRCVVLPGCLWELFSITPNRGAGGSNGWSDSPGNITGGHLNFYYGYVDANTAALSANFKYYATGTTVAPGTPDFQISGLDINSAGENFTSFTDMVGYTVTAGQQVTVRFVNNLTTSGSPGYHSFQCINFFRTV